MTEEFLISELVAIRQEKGISRRELARVLEASPNSVEAWELMTVPAPSIRRLIKWAEFLGYEFELMAVDRRREAAE